MVRIEAASHIAEVRDMDRMRNVITVRCDEGDDMEKKSLLGGATGTVEILVGFGPDLRLLALFLDNATV